MFVGLIFFSTMDEINDVTKENEEDTQIDGSKGHVSTDSESEESTFKSKITFSVSICYLDRANGAPVIN